MTDGTATEALDPIQRLFTATSLDEVKEGFAALDAALAELARKARKGKKATARKARQMSAAEFKRQREEAIARHRGR